MPVPADDPLSELAELTVCLLDTNASPGDHWTGVQRLHALFSQLCPLAEEDPCSVHHARVGLANGVAISQVEAARCITDYARTTKFLQGIDRVIRRRQQTSSRPVHIFYAGCGPFATLVTPLLTRFTPEQVQVTLLDVQNSALESTQRLWSILNMSKHLRAHVCDDASTIRLAEGEQFDILISETMQRALAREPQVAIYRNLVPQLRPDVDLIPASVKIAAKLLDIRSGAGVDARTHSREIGQVFELSRTALGTYPVDEQNQLPAGSIELPNSIPAGQQLVLSTHVQILEELVLRDHESSLTMPVRLETPTPSDHTPRLDFHYRLGQEPGLEWRSVHANP